MRTPYETEPPKEAVENLQGPAVIEFGTNWCGYCKSAEPLIETAFAGNEGVRHIKVEDAKGRPLGRSYRVKLWPTLIFLRDGAEVARVVRPTDSSSISAGLAKIA